MCAEPVPEFDCCECGRHIVMLCGTLPDPLLCAACLCVPGWYSLPAVARLIDPEHDRTVADDA